MNPFDRLIIWWKMSSREAIEAVEAWHESTGFFSVLQKSNRTPTLALVRLSRLTKIPSFFLVAGNMSTQCGNSGSVMPLQNPSWQVEPRTSNFWHLWQTACDRPQNQLFNSLCGSQMGVITSVHHLVTFYFNHSSLLTRRQAFLNYYFKFM